MTRAARFISLAFCACTASSSCGCGLTDFATPTRRAELDGSGGTNGSDGGGHGGDAGAGCNGSKRFPSTPILDSFDRPNGAVGGNWTGSTGAFSIQNGALSGSDVGGDYLFWKTSFGANQEVYATLIAFDPKLYDMSLVFKAQSTTEDCSAFHVRYANGYTALHSVLALQCEGTFSILFDHEVPPFHSGARLGARVSSNGCIEVFAHDADPQSDAPPEFTFLGSANAPKFAAIGFPGYVGLYSQVTKSGAPGVASVWDDFGGGEVR